MLNDMKHSYRGFGSIFSLLAVAAVFLLGGYWWYTNGDQAINTELKPVILSPAKNETVGITFTFSGRVPQDWLTVDGFNRPGFWITLTDTYNLKNPNPYGTFVLVDEVSDANVPFEIEVDLSGMTPDTQTCFGTATLSIEGSNVPGAATSSNPQQHFPIPIVCGPKEVPPVATHDEIKIFELGIKFLMPKEKSDLVFDFTEGKVLNISSSALIAADKEEGGGRYCAPRFAPLGSITIESGKAVYRGPQATCMNDSSLQTSYLGPLREAVENAVNMPRIEE